jgi:hypothetical protein
MLQRGRERKRERPTKGNKAEKDERKKNQNLLNNLIIYLDRNDQKERWKGRRERERVVEGIHSLQRLFEILSLLVQDDV